MVEGVETLGTSVPERRSLPRTHVSVPLSVYAEERLVLRARTVDLSAAGALLHGTATIEVGQAVRVEITRGASRNPLSLAAEVVRIATPSKRRRQHGVAVRFVEMSELDAAILRSIIEAARR